MTELVCAGGMWCPAGDPYFVPRLLQYDGIMDAESIDAAMKHVKQWAVAVDCGAHIGTWTKILAGLFDTTFAFEPEPTNFDALTRNLGDIGNVKAHKLALASRHARFAIGKDDNVRNSGSHFMKAPGPVHDFVFAVPLDMLDLEGVGFVKIDVEGMELEVLKGAERTLSRCRPVVCIEQNATSSRYNVSSFAAAQWLTERGWEEVERIEFMPNNFDLVMVPR